MRKFSIRPTLTLKGRTFKGLRGWSGKPLHPPLTDFPIVAYVLAAGFDVISAIGGKDHAWARELLARRHVHVHRRRGGVGVRRLDGSVGCMALIGGRHPGPTHDQLARHDHGHRHGARPRRHRVATERLPHRTGHPDRDRRVVRRDRRCWCRWVRRSGGPSSTTTGSTSRRPAIRRCGTSRRPTCFPATTRATVRRDHDASTVRRAGSRPAAGRPLTWTGPAGRCSGSSPPPRSPS